MMDEETAGERGHEPAPAFNPVDWVAEATRHVDVAEGAEPLLSVLAAHDIWDPAGRRELQRDEVVQRLAETLRPRTPLFELTAALIAPYLPAALGAAGDELRGEPASIRANLCAVMAHLFAPTGAASY